MTSQSTRAKVAGKIKAKKAAILGCGSGGMTMVVDPGLKGFKINPFDFPEFDKNLKSVEEQGFVERKKVPRKGPGRPLSTYRLSGGSRKGGLHAVGSFHGVGGGLP